MKKKTTNKIKEKIKEIKIFIKNVYDILCKPEMNVLPGQLAFSLILSLVPIITLIGYGASFFNLSMDSIIDIIRNNFDSKISNMIVPIISGNAMDLKLIITLIVMFYFASDGAGSIIFSANEIYKIKQTTWIKRKIKAIGLTLLIIILFLFILLVPVFGERIINAIDFFNIKSILTQILSILSGPISWLIIFVFIKIIFTIAPNRSIEASRINLGAIFTTFGWIIVTAIYSFYIRNFANYDLFYAGLSNIAVLMLWIYFLSYILVIGLSLTARVDKNEMEKTGSIK